MGTYREVYTCRFYFHLILGTTCRSSLCLASKSRVFFQYLEPAASAPVLLTSKSFSFSSFMGKSLGRLQAMVPIQQGPAPGLGGTGPLCHPPLQPKGLGQPQPCCSHKRGRKSAVCLSGQGTSLRALSLLKATPRQGIFPRAHLISWGTDPGSPDLG